MDGWNIYLNSDIIKKYNIPFYGMIISDEQKVFSSSETLANFIIETYKIKEQDIPLIVASSERKYIDDNNININNANNLYKYPNSVQEK